MRGGAAALRGLRESLSGASVQRHLCRRPFAPQNRLNARKNVRLMNKIDHVSKKNLRDKILNYLSSESMHAGSNTFTIPYSRQGLADYLNADRSALSNELSKLQKEGVLSYKKNAFSLKY